MYSGDGPGGVEGGRQILPRNSNRYRLPENRLLRILPLSTVLIKTPIRHLRPGMTQSDGHLIKTNHRTGSQTAVRVGGGGAYHVSLK